MIELFRRGIWDGGERDTDYLKWINEKRMPRNVHLPFIHKLFDRIKNSLESQFKLYHLFIWLIRDIFSPPPPSPPRKYLQHSGSFIHLNFGPFNLLEQKAFLFAAEDLMIMSTRKRMQMIRPMIPCHYDWGVLPVSSCPLSFLHLIWDENTSNSWWDSLFIHLSRDDDILLSRTCWIFMTMMALLNINVK